MKRYFDRNNVLTELGPTPIFFHHNDHKGCSTVNVRLSSVTLFCVLVQSATNRQGDNSIGRDVNREGFNFKLAMVKMCFHLTHS